MIESSRLNYIRNDQEKLRYEMYKGVKEVVLNRETTPSSCGKRIILPSSFTGGPRYMIQNYQDTMAICKVVGYPDLFITFTCILKWPGFEDFLNNRELNLEDRPDIVCRVFKAKLNTLIKDVEQTKFLAELVQKRGLPHAHILLFLHKDDKFSTVEDIDKIISAEIPNKETDPEYFDAVEKHMMHGPCGVARKDLPCMENAKCIRHFPKRFVESTTIDDDGHDRVSASFYKSVADEENMDDYDKVRFHLPDEQNLIFKDNEKLDDVIREASVKESMFLGWFQANKIYSEARFGERYYLRLLLNYVRGPTCYEDIRTIDGVVYSSFKDACYARGLLDDDKKYAEAIVEANHWGSELILTEDENIINKYNKNLKDFPPMPMSDTNQCNNLLYPNGMNRLICDELKYDRQKLAAEHVTYLGLLTDEQKEVYNEVITAVQTGKGGVFFLYVYGGTEKTFVSKTLASALRYRSHIVLIVASSGIASLLLPGGRTTHSCFAIPLNIDEFSICNIKQGSALVELLIKTKLIIWEEAPMVNRFCIEALDRTMHDILRFNNTNSLE
ncbi:uncharacterized protein [Arachis hypogaea]|uniref:uncharacterized protein n=1 Tax=Arachis hypogaea TaxID=3818 RepID=UPI003B223B4E